MRVPTRYAKWWYRQLRRVRSGEHSPHVQIRFDTVLMSLSHDAAQSVIPAYAPCFPACAADPPRAKTCRGAREITSGIVEYNGAVAMAQGVKPAILLRLRAGRLEGTGGSDGYFNGDLTDADRSHLPRWRYQNKRGRSWAGD